MARIFTEGFEMGDGRGPLYQNVQIVTSPKRSGNYAGGRYDYIAAGMVIPIEIGGSVSEIFGRVAFYTTKFRTTDYIKIFIRSDTTTLAQIDLAETYRTVARVGGVIVATGTKVISTGTWYLLEFYYKLSDSDGSFKIKIDGLLDIDYSGDTKPGTIETFNNIRILAYKHFTSGGDQFLDDLAVNDTTGSVDNSWCGDGKIVALKPNANGAVSQLVNSAGNSDNNYTFVDDIPADSDTTYVAGDVPGKHDLYNFQNISLSVGYRITRVWAEARAKDAAGGAIKLIVKPNNIIYKDANPTNLGTIYVGVKGDEMRVNPETGLEWTDGDVNALQAGVEIQ